MRFCTTELKIRTIRRWCVKQYGKGVTWTQVVGLRADEPRRVERIMDPARQKKAGKESRSVVVPLSAAGVAKADVMAFWQAQPFDLGLVGAWEGNCDGCFLKRRAALARMFRDYPERMEWWADVERNSSHKGTLNPAIALFRADRENYTELRNIEFAQGRLDLDLDDDGADVFAACDVGCGA
jgi:hypothetical protein